MAAGHGQDLMNEPVIAIAQQLETQLRVRTGVIQLEAGVKYRMSSNLTLRPEYNINNINGFSVGIGVKIGVFNMGKNRYKQNL